MYHNDITCTAPAYALFATTVQAWTSFDGLFPFYVLQFTNCLLRKRILLHRPIPNPRKLREVGLPESLKADRTIINYRYNR